MNVFDDIDKRYWIDFMNPIEYQKKNLLNVSSSKINYHILTYQKFAMNRENQTLCATALD